VSLSRTVVVAFALVENLHAIALSLAPIPPRLTVGPTHGVIDVEADARLTDSSWERRAEDVILAAQAGRTLAVVQALVRGDLSEDLAVELQCPERSIGGNALEPRLLAGAAQDSLAWVDETRQDVRLDQLELGPKRFAESQHVVEGSDFDDSDDAGRLRALALGAKAFVPSRVDPTHTFAVELETFDELVCRRETALTVFLSFAYGLLVALINGTPLAGAREFHALFHTQM
jgi:hypothetical protein